MATETFTITLDGIGTSTSVTINDTSQSAVAGSQLLTSSGTFTVPTGVTSINVYAVGGGAGGPPGQYSSGSGNGGGGGSYARVTGLTVQPGDVFTVSVGDGGIGGSVSTNSPFETVNGASQKYPQAGTVTNATAGGTTTVTWSRSGSDIGAINCYGGSTNRGGGSAQGDAALITAATDYDFRVGGNGGTAGTVTAGGGGGGGYGGMGGRGLGAFHRSSGGYNYYKAASGGDGGGMRLFGGTTQGSGGTNAPALGSGPYNYTGATDGGDGGDSGGDAYGQGGGGGAGGRIRDQTIYSGSYSYTYRWFLAHSGQNGGAGAVRFAWGT